jgi:hypothetical protein
MTTQPTCCRTLHCGSTHYKEQTKYQGQQKSDEDLIKNKTEESYKTFGQKVVLHFITNPEHHGRTATTKIPSINYKTERMKA